VPTGQQPSDELALGHLLNCSLFLAPQDMALTPWLQWLLQTIIHRQFAVARMQSMLYITPAKGLLLGFK